VGRVSVSSRPVTCTALHNKRLELPAGAEGFGDRSLRRPGRPPQLTRSVIGTERERAPAR
jgi:hypothetical protein